MQVHFLQHVSFEGPAILEHWAESHGYDTQITKLYNGDTLPDPPDVDLLIIMGGPMGVHDEERYPWLSEEKEFIKECLRREIKIVGICLGGTTAGRCIGSQRLSE